MMSQLDLHRFRRCRLHSFCRAQSHADCRRRSRRDRRALVAVVVRTEQTTTITTNRRCGNVRRSPDACAKTMSNVIGDGVSRAATLSCRRRRPIAMHRRRHRRQHLRAVTRATANASACGSTSSKCLWLSCDARASLHCHLMTLAKAHCFQCAHRSQCLTHEHERAVARWLWYQQQQRKRCWSNVAI